MCRGTARRGRIARPSSTSTSTPVVPVQETVQVADGEVPMQVVDETLPVEMTPETPQNNGQSSVVQIVDLITPLPATRVIRRPVEVDLTCDLEDEVFVVLVSKHVYWQHSIKLIILFYCRKTL